MKRGFRILDICRRHQALIAIALVSVLAGRTTAGAAGQALIINDSLFGRVETVEATNALSAILLDKTITPVVLTLNGSQDPGDLTPYACVWDLRIDVPLTSAEYGRMIPFAQGGGGLFLMGESANFVTRDNSLTSLVAQLGGGSAMVSTAPVTATTRSDILEPMNPQHALASQCDAVTEVDYDGVANGQFLSFGNGVWVSGTPASAGAADWNKGKLTGAPNGKVVIVLDVNFLADGTLGGGGTLDHRILDPTIPTQNRAFVKNMVTELCGLSCCGAPKGPKNPKAAASPCSATSR